MEGELFYSPSSKDIASSRIEVFRRHVCDKHKLDLPDYWALHKWSVDEPAAFWNEVWDYFHLIGSKGDLLYDAKPPINSTGTRLPTARLNYAENLLLAHSNARSNSKTAIYSAVEGVKKGDKPITLGSYTFDQLYLAVVATAQKLQELGIGPGDNVSAYSPSNAEVAIVMLATSAIGAVWSCIAAEAGSTAVLDRLTQTKPKLLLTADSYRYNSSTYHLAERLDEILPQLQQAGLQHVLVVGQLRPDRQPSLGNLPKTHSALKWNTWPSFHSSKRHVNFQFWRGPALAPLWVLFSSGTTGTFIFGALQTNNTSSRQTQSHRTPW
jgi:acetoacetyl-CoA synthetase